MYKKPLILYVTWTFRDERVKGGRGEGGERVKGRRGEGVKG